MIFLSITIIIVVFILFILLVNTFGSYKPAVKEELIIMRGSVTDDNDNGSISFVIWNIGYCGLGKEMDFFYEGGSMVMPPRENYEKYLQGVSGFITNCNSKDFVLLQEVDLYASRSYKLNQSEHIARLMPSHSSVFGVNYDAKFIPFPLYNPMGRVKSGQMTLSKYNISSAERIALPGSYYWPKNLFFPDRCLIVAYIPLAENKTMVVINVHNSAFDDASEIRTKEINFIKHFMIEEYSKGNYVVAGGDWNMNPFAFDSSLIKKEYVCKNVEPRLTDYFLPEGWEWVYDKEVPTNRDVVMAYMQGTTPTSLLDFFIVSPNIEVLNVKAHETGFEFSDHQPVEMTIKLVKPSNL